MNNISLASILTLVGALTFTGWKLNSVTVQFNQYKEVVNDQAQQAKDEKIRIESEQREKFNKKSLELADSQRRLADAFERMRNNPSGSSTMPRETTDTSRTDQTTETQAGACEGTEFWRDALSDTLQCSKLIEFVSD